jgi:hypothetical protein
VIDGDREPITGDTFTIVANGAGAGVRGGKLFLPVTLNGEASFHDAAWLYGDVTSPRMAYREFDSMIPGQADRISSLTGKLVSAGWLAGNFSNSGGTTLVTAITDGSVTKTIAPPGSTSGWVNMLNVWSPTRYAMYSGGYCRTRADGSLQVMRVQQPIAPLTSSDHIFNAPYYTASSSQLLWTVQFDSPSRPNPIGVSFALYRSTDSGTAFIVRDMDPAPTTPASQFGAPIGVWAGENGSYVAFSHLLDYSSIQDFGVALCTNETGTFKVKRLPQQMYTDEPNLHVVGVDYTSIQSNTAGSISIRAGIAATGSSQVTQTIGVGDAATGLRTAAKQGDPIPASIAGADGLNFGTFGSSNAVPQLNEVGDLGFYAAVSGIGVTSSNDGALWLYDHTGALSLLAREEQAVSVNGVSHTIASFGLGIDALPTVYFDASGSPILPITFTDGAKGLFLAQAPEPGGLSIVLMGLMLGAKSGRLERLTRKSCQKVVKRRDK